MKAMNQFGNDYAKSLAHKLEMEEIVVRELMDDLSRFKDNNHTELSMQDASSIDWTIKKTGEALECLHLSSLNMRSLAQ